MQSRTNYVSLRPFSIALLIAIAVMGSISVAGLAGVSLGGGIVGWLPTVALVCASSLWVYRVHSNARALGATGFRFSAVSAAVLIVIPFANIYASRMIYQELWMLCTGRPEPKSPLVLWWWRLLMFGLVLVLALSFAIAFKPALAGVAVAVLSLYPLATMALYSMIVLEITQRQTAARTRQLALSDAAPMEAPAGAMPKLSLINLEGIIGLTLVFVLSVGVPAFIQTLKIEKRTRAGHELKKLYRVAQELEATGQLPESVEATPPLGTCCGMRGKCMPDPTWWQHPTWNALGFSVDDPHYESYEFVRTGKTFKVIAYADRDCDTTYARFEMSSASGPDVIEEENPRE
jgi:hypothetical protein